MTKKLFQIILITTTLFSYEITLGKSSASKAKVQVATLETDLQRDDLKELVIDKRRGLMWQDNIDTQTVRKNRKDAKQYCRSLVFAGYDDWYLPRVKELKLIVNEVEKFKYMKLGHYWTSSPNLSDIVTATNVDFKSGQTYNSTRKGKAYVRCVRGNYNSLI